MREYIWFRHILVKNQMRGQLTYMKQRCLHSIGVLKNMISYDLLCYIISQFHGKICSSIPWVHLLHIGQIDALYGCFKRKYFLGKILRYDGLCEWCMKYMSFYNMLAVTRMKFF